MIVHEAVGVTGPVVAFIDEGEDIEECFPILVVLEEGFFLVSPIGEAIHRTGILCGGDGP